MLPQFNQAQVASTKAKYDVKREDIATLLKPDHDPEARVKRKLWLAGFIISPVLLGGMLFGHARAYNRFYQYKGKAPELANLTPISRVSMWLFGAIFWISYLAFFYVLYLILRNMSPVDSLVFLLIILIGLAITVSLCVFAFRLYRNWQVGIANMLLDKEKFGTAKFADPDELLPYTQKQGIYIGGGYKFDDKGHLLTVAGTRGGKGTNLIIPNLLDVGGYHGSFVVIDPKGENAAITARYQRERGQKVVILNPWGLLLEKVGEADSFNPLDVLADKNSDNLVDDVQIIAEMIVPIDKGERDKFFTDNARSIVAGLLLYLVLSAKDEKRHLMTLWEWLRLSGDDWNNLIADMHVYEHETYGKTVSNAANEILKLMKAGENTYGSILATVLQNTEFLKSPALQKSMQSGFDPYRLADGKTTVYIIIPADKLKSHARWLRLIFTTMMRAVVRKPNKRVVFLLDEFAALGYLSEIEVALSTYAGFNITLWAILQSLIQLKGIYADLWETFTANCTVRQFFSVNDNFTAEYVSKAIGTTSHVIYTKSRWRIEKSEATKRELVTPDELRRGSGDNIFAFIAAHPVTYFPKLPYYLMSNLRDNGKERYDENPYIKL